MIPLILRNCISVAAFIVISALNTSAFDKITYESDGYGSTEKDAVSNALKKVSWSCMSDFSEMPPDSIKSIVQKIDISKLVKSYSVLKSSDSTENDSTKVSVHAEMNMPEVINLLEKHHGKSPLNYYPRVLLDIKNNSTGQIDGRDAFMRMIENKLTGKKMVLYGHNVTDSLFPRSRALGTGENPDSYYKAGADFAITGSIETGEPYTVEVYGTKQKRVSCCANLQLVDCSDARVLTSVSLCEDWGSQSETMACEKCFDVLLKNKKFTLIDSIETIWGNYQYSVFPVSINLHDLENSKIIEIENNIKKLPSVIKIASKILNEKESRLNILCRGSMLDIFNSISDIKDISISISAKGYMHIYDNTPDIKSDNLAGTQTVTDTNITINQISVTGYTIPPLYPCAAANYSSQPYGTITLSNNTQKKLEKVRLSSTISDLSMPRDTIIDLIVPHKEVNIPITAVIDQKKIQKIDHSTTTKLSVRCSFKEENKINTTDFHLPVTINGLNDFDWKKPEMISSFITPADQVVKGLSRLALSSVNYIIDSLPQNITQAIAVYECLRKAGIAYIKDITVRKNIDNIQFPFQTILMGTGDCDDTSVLLASLLESIGIETSMLVSDNHVLIMFNTGVHSKNSYLISHDTSKYIVYKDMIWLPVETTNFNTMSFLDAWKKGLEQYHDSRDYGFISIINTHQSWETYPPANPFHDEITIPKINSDDLHNTIDNIVNQFVINRNEELEKVEKKYLSMSVKNPDKAQFNRLGILYAQNKQYNKSLVNFRKAFEADTLDPDVSVNLANIYCLTGRYDSAEQLYSHAVQRNPSDYSYYLNQYLFYLKSNQPEKSTESLRKFIEKAGVKKLNSYLGLDLASDLSDWNESNKGGNVSNDRYSISIQLIKNSIKRLGKTITAPGKKRGTPVILPVGDRINMVDLRNLFFFKTLQD